jgi:hypothetical protein
MRNPGDRSADRMPGRRKGAGGRSAVSGPPAGGDGQPAQAGSSLFVPGYAGDRPPTGDTGRQAAVRTSGGWRGAMAGTAAKGPVRGFPPAPGQPPPVYPPGQFSAWNRAARPAADGLLDGGQAADGWAAPDYSEPASHGSAAPWPPEPGYADPGYGEPGYGEPGYGEPGYGDPDYSVLAVSDPTADVTATQSWGVVDASRRTKGQAGPGALAEPPQARQAGQTEHAPAGQTSQADRARPDTGGHRLQGPQPGSSGPASDAGRLPEPAAGAGSRPDRPRADRPPARRAHARTRRTKRPGRVLLACGLVLALVAGGAAYFWLSSGHQGAGQAAAVAKQSARTPRQSQTATPSPSLGPWGHIETRAADPLALTLAELFPGTVSAGGSAYARTVERNGTNCAKAVIGAALQSAVKQGKCSQVMRASYLSGNSKVMGTIGVLNLISVTAAEKSGKAAGGGDFIDQLPAAKGPARHLTKGTGLEETEIKGHYLVMVWAEFANLHAPKTKGQRLELEAFCNRLIQNTANLSLASRLVTGKPRVP